MGKVANCTIKLKLDVRHEGSDGYAIARNSFIKYVGHVPGFKVSNDDADIMEELKGLNFLKISGKPGI